MNEADILKPVLIADERVEIHPCRYEAPLIVVDGRLSDNFRPQAARVLLAYAIDADKAVSDKEMCNTFWGEHNNKTEAALRSMRKVARHGLGKDPEDPLRDALTRRAGIGTAALSSLDLNKVGFEKAGNKVSAAASNRIELDHDLHAVKVDGIFRADFTATELAIIEVLIRRPDRPVAAENIINEAFKVPYSQKQGQVLRTLISRVRSRLGDELGHVKHGAIKNHVTEGYSLVSSLQS